MTARVVMDLQITQIQELTVLLRTSSDPFWLRLRELLKDRGVDPDGSILAECFPDDSDFEFGIILDPSDRVIQFGFDYLHREISQGQFSEWEDLTERYLDSPYRETVKAAIDLRRTGTKFGPG